MPLITSINLCFFLYSSTLCNSNAAKIPITSSLCVFNSLGAVLAPLAKTLIYFSPSCGTSFWHRLSASSSSSMLPICSREFAMAYKPCSAVNSDNFMLYLLRRFACFDINLVRYCLCVLNAVMSCVFEIKISFGFII